MKRISRSLPPRKWWVKKRKFQDLQKAPKSLLNYKEPSDCKVKWDNNVRWVDRIIEHTNACGVVWLDAESQLTYKALNCSLKCYPSKFFSPNLDPKVVAKFRRTNVYAPLMSAEDFIRTHEPTLSSAYFDFQGVITGGQGLYPMATIDQFLKHTPKKLGSKVVLAITVAMRNNRRHKDYFCDCGDPNHSIDQKALTDELMGILFRYHSFKVLEKTVGEQTRTMHHVLYVLKRVPQTEEEVTFIGGVTEDGSYQYLGFPPNYVE